MPRADTWDRFDWPGQGLAIDLADTIVVVRPGESIDHLDGVRQLTRWLELERPWLGPTGADADERLDDFRALREAIRALFFAVSSHALLPRESVRTVNRYSAQAPSYPQLEALGGKKPRAAVQSQASPTQRALAAIAGAAIDLLGSAQCERLRVCPAPSCGMFFLAEKPRQRWCRDRCGNRARVARHHALAAEAAALAH